MDVPFIKSTKKTVHYLSIAAMFYFYTFTILLFIVQWNISYIVNEGHSSFKIKLFLLFIVFNIFSNYGLVCSHAKRSYYAHFPNSSLPRFSTSDWIRFCENCQEKIPPRAKHCSICEQCVLKRGHHCYFTNCCIGFRNQRFFIVLSCYCCIGALLGLYLLLQYLNIYFVPFFSLGFYQYLMPHVCYSLIFGRLTLITALTLFFTYLTLTTSIGAAYFLSVQFFLIYSGQTEYELMRGIKIYKASLYENLQSVFGPYWLLQFIVPLPLVNNVGNGIEWKQNYTKHL